jgi:hypothetical protein
VEGIILDDLVIGSGALMSGIVLLVLALGSILMGYLADQEKAGKRFFWTDTSLPEPELRTFLPKDVGIRHAG